MSEIVDNIGAIIGSVPPKAGRRLRFGAAADVASHSVLRLPVGEMPISVFARQTPRQKALCPLQSEPGETMKNQWERELR